MAITIIFALAVLLIIAAIFFTTLLVKGFKIALLTTAAAFILALAGYFGFIFLVTSSME